MQFHCWPAGGAPSNQQVCGISEPICGQRGNSDLTGKRTYWTTELRPVISYFPTTNVVKTRQDESKHYHCCGGLTQFPGRTLPHYLLQLCWDASSFSSSSCICAFSIHMACSIGGAQLWWRGGGGNVPSAHTWPLVSWRQQRCCLFIWQHTPSLKKWTRSFDIWPPVE